MRPTFDRRLWILLFIISVQFLATHKNHGPNNSNTAFHAMRGAKNQSILSSVPDTTAKLASQSSPSSQPGGYRSPYSLSRSPSGQPYHSAANPAGHIV